MKRFLILMIGLLMALSFAPNIFAAQPLKYHVTVYEEGDCLVFSSGTVIYRITATSVSAGDKFVFYDAASAQADRQILPFVCTRIGVAADSRIIFDAGDSGKKLTNGLYADVVAGCTYEIEYAAT